MAFRVTEPLGLCDSVLLPWEGSKELALGPFLRRLTASQGDKLCTRVTITR